MERIDNMYKKNRIILRVCALMLACFLLLPGTAHGAVIEPAQPYASDYIVLYNAHISAKGNSIIEIWFTAVGDTDMDEIGAQAIILYESINQTNWTQVIKFSHQNFPSMLIEDNCTHSSYIPYRGVAGRYYKALVCIWAGKAGGGDSRTIWTVPVKAT